ncbi:MAG: hypothetical protein Q8M19_14055 [Reyranella sp.]|nr:hypothetical protein [Reyranella sp.]
MARIPGSSTSTLDDQVTPAPEAAPSQAPVPKEGGSWRRDPQTGELTPAPKEKE